MAVASNIAKFKTLSTSKAAFNSIAYSIENIPRIPPKNKQFFNNSIISITKYINGLLVDYLKQIKREK
jgi:hypothetical protein